MKKCQHWPKVVNGDIIKAHFKRTAIGHKDYFRIHLLEADSKLGMRFWVAHFLEQSIL